MQASRDTTSGHPVEEDDMEAPGLSSPSQVSDFDSFPTTPCVGPECAVGRGSPLPCEQYPQAFLRAKPPLSPVAVHRSHSRKTVSRPINASTFPRTPCSNSLPTSRLGAVASLAVEGGLSEADLQKLGVGQDLRFYCATAPAGFSSSDENIDKVRNCLEKRCYQWHAGTRFSRLPADRTFHRIPHHHHTAPPGTVLIHPNFPAVSESGASGVRSPPTTSQEANPVYRISQRYQRLYRRNRINRCDICLSSPTSKNTSPGGGVGSGAVGMCSFNSSRRASPLHLTRVGGIMTNVSSTGPQGTPEVETSRKGSQAIDVSCIASPTGVVRLGPGNTVVHSPFEGTGFVSSTTTATPTTSTTTTTTTTAPNYVRINWCAQPYTSISSNICGLAVGTEFGVSDVTNRTGQFSTPRNIPAAEMDPVLRLSMLSDGNLETQPLTVPVSPSAQSTSSVPLTLGEKNSCTARKQGQDFHFFGASYTTARSVERPAGQSVLDNVDPSSNIESSGESKRRLQARIYQQHVARSVRHLRRYRHIYGDSLNSVPGATSTNLSHPSEESAEGRRCSADAALAIRNAQTGSSTVLIPPDSASSPQQLEGTNTSAGDSQIPGIGSIPVATVIVCLQNSSKKKLTWLHRRCFVHNGFLLLTSLTEDIPRVLETTLKPSTSPPSLCKSVWCYPLSECVFSWSPLSSVVQESIAQSGLLGSSQLHPQGCSFSVPATDCLSCGYTCKLFFLQRENLDNIIQGLQRISANHGPMVSPLTEGRTQTVESDPSSSVSPSGIASLLAGKDVRGKNYGLAGHVGAFPLMVAAETLAASFGVQMNRGSQSISVRSPPTVKPTVPSQCGSTDAAAPSDPISTQDVHEVVTTTVTLESAPNVQQITEQEKTFIGGKGSLLRSTFARMKQAAFSSSSSSSTCSPNSSATSHSRTTGSKFTPTATTKAFQQHKPFFSSSTTSCTLSSPEPAQQGSAQANDGHHSFHATPETEAELLQQQPDNCNQAQVYPEQAEGIASSSQPTFPTSVLRPEAHDVTVATTICIPLTATLEPTYSVLQSFSNETDLAPVSAQELQVTSPVQVAIVDSTLFTQSSPGTFDTETTNPTATKADEEKINETALVISTTSINSTSISMSTSKTSTTTKETVIGKTKPYLRRPNDSTCSVEANAEEPTDTATNQAKQSHRSQLGSLALHRCPRSTVSPFVPFVVELCVTLVERFGLNCVGIYRVSGNKVAHDFISSQLTNKIDEIDTSSDKWNDINAVSCVLKTFLRNLPDSLIPKMMYSDFLTASRLESWERRLLSVQRLLGIMECYVGHPEYRAHRATLRYLATHLARVASRQAVNRMTPYNLALVFAPNLVQPSEDTPELFIADSKFKIWLVETIIKYHKWVFSPDLGLESGCFVPEDSDEIAEIEARSDSLSVDLSGAGTLLPTEEEEQPGRAEGDVRPILRELLSAAAQLPPPPSDSDLESAEEPGPSSDRPAPVTVAAALLSRKGSSRTGDMPNRRQSSSSLPGAERISEAETECEAANPKGTYGSSIQTQLSPIERIRLDRLSFLSADPSLPQLDPATVLKSSEQAPEK
uniref:Rho-GAP domain-containing protein n=1 Tax=Schistocephalus solidus TaxID=70667 RepID=A0A0X3QCF8_SCHSO